MWAYYWCVARRKCSFGFVVVYFERGPNSHRSEAKSEQTPVSESYELDSGDHLRIRFYDRYDRDDLNGEYVIGVSGEIRLPRIGVFTPRRKTVAELEQDIRQAAEKKGEKLGYFAIDVTKCRPFYVVGLVNRPGPYAFVPGLTVLHAVSLSGGLYRSPLTSIVEAAREKNSRRSNKPCSGTHGSLGPLESRTGRL